MQRRCRGFTLIELMLVLVVIGLIYAVVFLSLDHVLTRYRLRGAARTVLATMELARSQAVSQQQPFQIVFDIDNATFWLRRLGPARRTDQEPTRRTLERGIRFSEITASREARKKGTIAIEYTPLGCACPCEVRLSSDDGRTLTIKVNPLHGYARLQG